MRRCSRDSAFLGTATVNSEIELVLEGGHHLRILQPGDVHTNYVAGLNDLEVNRYLDAVKRVKQTEESAVQFVQKDLCATDAVLFGIWLKDAAQHCGTVRLHGIDKYHKTAHIGICLFQKEAWGNKLGSKAINAVTQWAFDNLDLRWIEAAAYKENIASQRSFIAVGYEWVYDIKNKYLLDGVPDVVKVFVARNKKYGKHAAKLQD